MRTIVFVLLAGCGAQPNQPVLANVPRPNPAAMAGGAAAAAAAITLASPDSHNPEKKQPDEKKAVEVKESVPAGVLDRLDQAESAPNANPPGGLAVPRSEAKQRATGAKAAQPAPQQPRDALDFSNP